MPAPFPGSGGERLSLQGRAVNRWRSLIRIWVSQSRVFDGGFPKPILMTEPSPVSHLMSWQSCDVSVRRIGC